MPSAKEVQRCYPLREHSEELGALGLDAKSAHKLCVIKEAHRGLVGFSLNNKLYFYKVCPFGAKFSAHWWGAFGRILDTTPAPVDLCGPFIIPIC